MTITPHPHQPQQFPSILAYLVERDMGRVLYTGDLFSIQERYRDRIPDVDLVIAEGSFIRRGGLVRKSPCPAASMGTRNTRPGRYVLAPGKKDCHYPSWKLVLQGHPRSVQQIEGGRGFRVTVAEDGMTMDVGSTLSFERGTIVSTHPEVLAQDH
jgi:hypothetical protein